MSSGFFHVAAYKGCSFHIVPSEALIFVQEFDLAELNHSITSRVTEIELQLLSVEPEF